MNWKNSCMRTRTVSSKNSNCIESEQKSECAHSGFYFMEKTELFMENLRLNMRKTKEEGKQ